jgi:hypothetical protein
MRTFRNRRLHSFGLGALALGALAVTVGCGARAEDLVGVGLQSRTGAPGVPVLVSCEPHQRALVRPVEANGTIVSQVECVSSGVAAPSMMMPAAPAPWTGQPASARAASYPATVVAAPPAVVRPGASRVVVEQERRPERRSVKKSAIIIGSSAGVGAGVGAAVGGKKGALIGAAIGGGSAAIWDQVTRRK